MSEFFGLGCCFILIFLQPNSSDYIWMDYVVPSINTPGLAFLSDTCFTKIRWAASSGKVNANANTWFDGFQAATGQALVNGTMEDFQRYYKYESLYF